MLPVYTKTGMVLFAVLPADQRLFANQAARDRSAHKNPGLPGETIRLFR
jgi:hypothetical protein